MRSRALLPAFLFCLLLLPGLVRAQERRPAQNPIIWADVPDMSIVRVDSTYYMSSTTMHMSPGVPLMRSENLVDWELLSYAYDTLADNDALKLENGQNAYGKGSWASCLRYHEGTFVLSTFSATTGKTHIFRTGDIEKGPWEQQSFKPSLHDHSIFFDEDGRTYIIWGGGKLFLAEMKEDLSGIIDGSVRVLIANASAPSGEDMMLPAEGSQLFNVNGRYYLFNISWPRNGMRTVIVHRAEKLEGPWEGRVVLQDRGIAQGGLVDTPEGRWYAYLFRDHGSVGRIPYLVPVCWEEGWPVLGDKGRVPDVLDISSSGSTLPAIVRSDDFEATEGDSALAPQWQWNHNPDNNGWSLSERPGFLRLRNQRIDKDLLSTRNTLTQRSFGPQCSGIVKMEFSGIREGDHAGLAALQKNYGSIGITRSEDRNYIVWTDGRREIETELNRVPIEQDVVYFRLHMDFREQRDLATFAYSLNGREWTDTGFVLQMSYTLPHFMGYRFAIYSYATSHTGGYVDIDQFRVE